MTKDEQFKAAVDSTLLKSAGVVRKDSRAGRFYEVDGELYPSVTHALSVIAKPALIHWAATQERVACLDAAADLYLDVAKTPAMSRATFITTLEYRIGKQKAHRKTLDKACEIGSQVHALIEFNLRTQLNQKPGPEPKVIDDAQWAFCAFQDWATSVNLKPIFIEQVVFSKVHGYAGTMDLLAEVNGVPTLVDFKTSRAVYAESYLQNVAYQVALSEMGHPSAQGGLILRLPKVQTDPAFEVVPVPPVAELFPTFLAALELWFWWHAQEVAYQERRKGTAA